MYIVTKDIASCSGCSACMNICPKHCIVMKSDAEGFLYPYISEGCVSCGLCEDVCPFDKTEKVELGHEAWAARSCDDEIRMASSSGGLFTELAEHYVRKEGYIYGAIFSEDWQSVKHAQAPLSLIRESKYVQSDLMDSFSQVKKQLDEGKKVLFSGVPCQIAGLKHYLRKPYDNLLCIDIICHGVPSPKLWRKYVAEIENEHGEKVTGIRFRDKKEGWHEFGLRISFASKEWFSPMKSNPYMQLFLKNNSLRPSCYACRIKENGSSADITLGDFWGIESIAPDMDDNRGTSLVIIRTEKGKDLFNSIQKSLVTKPVTYQEIIKCNPALVKSVPKPESRNSFFSDMQSLSIKMLAKKYCPKRKKTLTEILVSTVLWKKIRDHIR